MSGDGLILHCILSLVSFFFFCSPFFFFFLITFLFFPLSLYPSFPPFLLSWNHWMSKETLNHQDQVACLSGGKPRSRAPQPCVAGSYRRGRGQRLGTANCRATLDPSVMVPPLGSESQPLSISTLSSSLAHYSAAVSLLCIIILRQGMGWEGGKGAKGFDQTLQTLRGCGEANTSRPDW